MIWLSAHGRLPAPGEDSRTATVTERSTEAWDYADGSERTNIHVRHLDGVRYPSEHRQWLRPKPGSPFARHRFRG